MGFYFSSGFQFRDFFLNLGNCRENLRKFFSLRSENVISRPLWACPEGRNITQNFPVPKLKTRLSLTGFLKRHDPTKSRSHHKQTLSSLRSVNQKKIPLLDWVKMVIVSVQRANYIVIIAIK
jgi:hypothetical protein